MSESTETEVTELAKLIFQWRDEAEEAARRILAAGYRRPGGPVIEPQGCPIPGACSCIPGPVTDAEVDAASERRT